MSLPQIVIEGIVGSSYKGDIAIDDIWMDDSPCPPPGSCDFELKTLCTWANVANANRSVGLDDFDWTLGSGDTASYQTGPSVDHTLGTSAGNEDECVSDGEDDNDGDDG